MEPSPEITRSPAAKTLLNRPRTNSNSSTSAVTPSSVALPVSTVVDATSTIGLGKAPTSRGIDGPQLFMAKALTMDKSPETPGELLTSGKRIIAANNSGTGSENVSNSFDACS